MIRNRKRNSVHVVTTSFVSVVLGLAMVFAWPDAGARASDGTAGSEGQGSLPSFNGGAGIAVVGSLPDLYAVFGASSGSGAVEYCALDDTLSMAVVSGNLRVNLDREALRERDLHVYLMFGDALANGLAEVGWGAWSSDPFLLSGTELELPLGALYGDAGYDPSDLWIHALGRDRDRYGLRVHQQGESLLLEQTLR